MDKLSNVFDPFMDDLSNAFDPFHEEKNGSSFANPFPLRKERGRK